MPTTGAGFVYAIVPDTVHPVSHFTPCVAPRSEFARVPLKPPLVRRGEPS